MGSPFIPSWDTLGLLDVISPSLPHSYPLSSPISEMTSRQLNVSLAGKVIDKCTELLQRDTITIAGHIGWAVGVTLLRPIERGRDDRSVTSWEGVVDAMKMFEENEGTPNSPAYHLLKRVCLIMYEEERDSHPSGSFQTTYWSDVIRSVRMLQVCDLSLFPSLNWASLVSLLQRICMSDPNMSHLIRSHLFKFAVAHLRYPWTTPLLNEFISRTEKEIEASEGEREGGRVADDVLREWMVSDVASFVPPSLVERVRKFPFHSVLISCPAQILSRSDPSRLVPIIASALDVPPKHPDDLIEYFLDVFQRISIEKVRIKR